MKKVFISTTGIFLIFMIIISSATLFKTNGKNDTVYSYNSSEYNTADPAPRSIGDIDGNGTVDIEDSMMIQRHVAKFTPENVPLIDKNNMDMLKIADVNCDNKLTVGDATVVQQLAAESIVVDPEKHEWTQVSSEVCDYLANTNYDPSDYSYSVIQKYAPKQPEASNNRPKGVSVNTPGGVLSRAGYTVDATPGDITVYNDIPNTNTTYAVSKNGFVSQLGTIKPTHFLRQIKCVKVQNVRDLGGWECDGGTVKYGILIRGGSPQADDRDVLINQCGIRTQIDLRGMDDFTTDIPTGSSMGDDIEYHLFPRYVWYSINDTEIWKMILRTAFDSVKNNKPVYFHCVAGADRTGTVACVLEAILGMSQSDIDKEYELTSFYTGTDSDLTARRRNESEWKNLISNICAKAPSKSNNKLRDGAVRFAHELGFTIDEINEFRNMTISGSPELLTND